MVVVSLEVEVRYLLLTLLLLSLVVESLLVVQELVVILHFVLMVLLKIFFHPSDFLRTSFFLVSSILVHVELQILLGFDLDVVLQVVVVVLLRLLALVEVPFVWLLVPLHFSSLVVVTTKHIKIMYHISNAKMRII
jgi:hypothetical protein